MESQDPEEFPGVEGLKAYPTITLKRWLSERRFLVPDLDDPGEMNPDYEILIEDELASRQENN